MTSHLPKTLQIKKPTCMGIDWVLKPFLTQQPRSWWLLGLLGDCMYSSIISTMSSFSSAAQARCILRPFALPCCHRFFHSQWPYPYYFCIRYCRGSVHQYGRLQVGSKHRVHVLWPLGTSSLARLASPVSIAIPTQCYHHHHKMHFPMASH